MDINKYISFDGTILDIKFFFPENWKKTDKRGVAVFYHGGGWITGTSAQFMPHAAELTRLGMVVALPTYRILRVDGTPVDVAIRDAMAALMFVFNNSDELGIDQEKVVVGGGSAGGHLALSTVLLDEFMPDNYPCKNKVKGILLCNPVVDCVEIKDRNESLKISKYKPEEVSPIHHLRKDLPDTIIFHGTGDTVVPFSTVVSLAEKMKDFNNSCTVVPYEGRKHSFFNLTTMTVIQDYYDILGHMVQFLYERDIIDIGVKKVDD